MGAASSNENPAEIMKLTDNCLQKVFDYIPLKDLCSIGLTCKRFNEVAGQYFADNYPSQKVWIDRENRCIHEHLQFLSERNVVDGCDTNFGRYARKFIISSDNIAEFRYAASIVNKNLKVIHFQVVDKLTPEHDQYIKKIMENIESITFCCCFRRNGSYTDILKHCKNLKYLSIESTTLNISIPTLESLQWYNPKWLNNKNTNTDNLEQFLRQNLQIKNLTTNINSRQLLDLTEKLNLELHELGIELGDENDADLKTLCVRLNNLHERGFFEQIKFKISYYDGNVFRDNIVQIQQIHALHTIYDYLGNFDAVTGFTAAFATLTNLKCLTVGLLSCDNFEVLAQGLVNLEQLNLGPNSMDNAVPFIRQLPKLKEIIISSMTGGTRNFHTKININALNNERQNLPCARKVIVYLLEREYLRLKWSQHELRYKWLEIKRAKSFIGSQAMD